MIRNTRKALLPINLLIIFVWMMFISRQVNCLRRVINNKATAFPNVFSRLSATTTNQKVETTERFNGADYPSLMSLGLNDKIIESLVTQGITQPTPVQRAVIPRLLLNENLVMAASTGSGKTLAYSLPVIQNLLQQEEFGYIRQPQRPRCLVLVPTRELARQVLHEIKQVGHFAKVSSAAVLGGETYSLQKKSLERLVDIVVASPGRLMQHKEQGNVFFSHVNTVIIDEVDTMLTQGFGSDIRAILRNVMNRKSKETSSDDLSNHGRKLIGTTNSDHSELKKKIETQKEGNVQLIMATATLTKAVRNLLADVEGGFNIEYSDPSNLTPKKLTGDETRVKMKIVEVDGVHRILPNVKHEFEDSKGKDKIILLRQLLERHHNRHQRTMIFCNTISSCRAVEYAINEESSESVLKSIQDGQRGNELLTLSYHGDMNSQQRTENLDLFREGKTKYLVCTDIAARGIDIPEIDHVVLFDFPLNPIDYLHRAGRCGRAGRKGLVTSLLAKRDLVLAQAIERAIAEGKPIDSLSADKKAYQPTNRVSMVIPRRSTQTSNSKSSTSSSRGGGRPSVFNRGRRSSDTDSASRRSSDSARGKRPFTRSSARPTPAQRDSRSDRGGVDRRGSPSSSMRSRSSRDNDHTERARGSSRSPFKSQSTSRQTTSGTYARKTFVGSATRNTRGSGGSSSRNRGGRR